MILPPIFYVDVKIDNNFTVKEKKIILKCLKSWHKACHGILEFVIIDMNMIWIDSDCKSIVHILKGLSTDELIIKADTKFSSNTNVGYAFCDGKQLFAVPVVDRVKNKKMFFKVTMHEIGHCIAGWGHLKKPTGIMYSRVNKHSKVTYDDLEMLMDNIRYRCGIS